MLILVCGSRSFGNYAILEETLSFACLHAVKSGGLPVIMHGAARGADMMADRFARENNVEVRLYPADWEQYGKRAGILRNLEMLDQKPDVIFAFWDGESTGTAHTIAEAKRRGFKVGVVMPDTQSILHPLPSVQP